MIIEINDVRAFAGEGYETPVLEPEALVERQGAELQALACPTSSDC
ncbi:MAG TPA: hypothetical protein VME20_09180 [Acidimicrobiales bacterium]|nr:hypothetical protein [Acidimicrobiales bacterium]